MKVMSSMTLLFFSSEVTDGRSTLDKTRVSSSSASSEIHWQQGCYDLVDQMITALTSSLWTAFLKQVQKLTQHDGQRLDHMNDNATVLLEPHICF